MNNIIKNNKIKKMSSPLTEQQIEEICQSIPMNKCIPVLVAESIVSNIRKKLATDLKTVMLYPSLFNSFKEEIVKYYYKTLTQAGESVGIITAQSIGERQTQSTLNSVTYETIILIRNCDKISKIRIGDFITEKIKIATKTDYNEEKDTTYSELDDYYEIPSCDEDGNVSWKQIEAVTKHPVINIDGSDTMLKIITEEQREVIATKSKSFLKLVNGKIIPVNGDSLKVGDYLPVSKKTIDLKENHFLELKDVDNRIIPRVIPLDYELGYLLGAYCSKGSMTNYRVSINDYEDEYIKPVISLCKRWNLLTNVFDNSQRWKTKDFRIHSTSLCIIVNELCGKSFVSDKIIFSNKVCLQGFLDGFIRKKTLSKDLLIDVQQMMNILDIYSFIKETINGYELVTGCKNESIPDEIDGKIMFRERKQDYIDVLFDKIVSIEEVENTTNYAYDLTVKDTKNFNLYNGLAIRDTFHSAGLTIKCVVTGVPRFSELLNATKDPKMVNCLIFLNQSFQDIPEIRKTIGNSFTEITLKRLVTNYDFHKGSLENWHNIFCDIYNIDKSKLDWRLRFTLDKNILYEYNINMKLIKQQIEKENPNMTVLYTPESKGIIDIFIEEFNKKEEEEEEEEVEEVEDNEEVEEVEDNEVDNDDIDQVEKKSIDILKEDFDDMPHDIEKTIKIEDKILPLLLKLKISGISKIKEIFFEKRKKDLLDEWVITTEGSNLYGLFSHPLVDKKRTLCNNMWEIYNTFGIEATRQFLIEEYMDVVTSDGTFVNSSHVELLVDVMVYTGSIISISRYGQKKVGSGPLSKASFEESLENFLKAGLNGEKETTDGVSASIMLGKIPKTGTGVFDLKMDLNSIYESEEKVEIEVKKSIFKTNSVHEKQFTKKNSLFT